MAPPQCALLCHVYVEGSRRCPQRLAKLPLLQPSSERPLRVCAVKRWRFPAGASPARQMLQPEATGAAMEATKWLKPSVMRVTNW